MIHRAICDKIRSLSRQFPVICVTGPRQSGKTTLVKDVFPGHSYVSLEDPETQEYAREDPREFLSGHAKGMIIDEIQRVPELLSYMQGIVDSRQKPSEFIITGSQNVLLHEKVSQTLAGRMALTRLLPLSIHELGQAGLLPKKPEEMAYKGGYPRIYAREADPNDWYPAYVRTYVERDLRLIKNITDLSLFQKFLRLCAGRIGQVLNLSSLGNDCGVSHTTVGKWLSVLEASYVIFMLQPYYKDFSKRLIKSPKIYFFDTGLACYLLGIDSPSLLSTHYLRGGIFESMIISDMIKQQWNAGKEHGCYYWRDKAGHEVDCIVETSGRMHMIEIKSGHTVASDYFDGMRYLSSVSGEAAGSSWVVYAGDARQKRSAANVISWKQTDMIFRQRGKE